MGVSIRDTGLPMPPTPTESTGKHMYLVYLYTLSAGLYLRSGSFLVHGMRTEFMEMVGERGAVRWERRNRL